MMKNNFTFLLVVFIAMALVGCKSKTVDVDDTLKQLTEETFAKTPTRSYLAVNGNDLRIVEYTFDATAKTAIRKELNLAQKAEYRGVQKDEFTYAWGEFSNGMYGRTLTLIGASGNRALTYLNDQVNDGDVVTTISEPRVEMAANMVNGLVGGKWMATNPTYVLQLHWVDTIVYEYRPKSPGSKILVCDTIHKNMPRPNCFDTVGVDSCFYYTYEFENGATSKPAYLKTDFVRNNIIADTTIQRQLQDTTKNDTIIKYTVTDGTRVPRSQVDYAYWVVTNLKEEKGVQSLDVTVCETDKEPQTLALSAYKYDGSKGSFVLNGLTYIFEPKK